MSNPLNSKGPFMPTKKFICPPDKNERGKWFNLSKLAKGIQL
jgi:hypothetical protein